MSFMGNVGSFKWEGRKMDKKSESGKRSLGLKVLSLALALTLVVGMVPAIAMGSSEEEQQVVEQQVNTTEEQVIIEDKVVSFAFSNAYATVNAGLGDQIFSGTSLTMPGTADLYVRPAANDGFAISEVYASSAAYPNNSMPISVGADWSFSIPQSLVDNSLVVTVIATPIEPEPEPQVVETFSTEEVTTEEIGTMAGESLSLSVSTTGVGENVLTGDIRDVSYMFGGQGVAGIIMAIPYSEDVALKPTTQVQNQTVIPKYTVSAEEAEEIGIPAGDYIIVTVPFAGGNATGGGMFTFSATCFENGVTAAGKSYTNDGYILEGVNVGAGNGVAGISNLAFATGADKTTPQRVSKAPKFISAVDETISIEKTAPTSFIEPRTRSYSEVKAEQTSPVYTGENPTHLYTATYTLDVRSSGNNTTTNPYSYGRINQTSVSITDTITGFVPGSIVSIVVKDHANKVVHTASPKEVADGSIDFKLTEKIAPLLDQTFTVEVGFKMLDYTDLYGDGKTVSMKTINNQAKLSHTPVTTKTEESKTSANVSYTFGFVQEAPGAATLNVQKKVDSTGNGVYKLYDSTLKNSLGGNTVTFKLTDTSGKEEPKIVTVDDAGTASFSGLTPGLTYTLEETVGVKDGYTTIKPVNFKVQLNAQGIAEIVVDGDTTDYSKVPYIAKNTNTNVGTISVYVEREMPGAVASTYGPFGDIEVGLYNSKNELVGTTKLSNTTTGQVVFTGLSKNETYTVEALTDKPNYQTPGVSSAISFPSTYPFSQNVTLTYKGTGGSFFLGKTFVYNDANSDGIRTTIIPSTFEAVFGLYPENATVYDETTQVGPDIRITQSTDTSLPVQQMFPAGTYKLIEKSLKVDGNSNPPFNLLNKGELKVTITNGSYSAVPSSTTGETLVNANKEVINTSNAGQLIIKSYDANGNALSGVTYAVYGEGSDTAIKTGTISATGYASVMLGAGTYKVVTTAPGTAANYTLYKNIGIDSVTIAATTKAVDGITASKLTLSQSGNKQTVAVMYAALPKISVNKVSADNTTVGVNGAKFALYKVSGNTYTYVADTTSAKDGSITFNNVPEGSYALVEYQAASGYLAPAYAEHFRDGNDPKKKTGENDGVDVSAINTSSIPKVTVSATSHYSVIDDVKTVGLDGGGNITNTRSAVVKIRTSDAASSAYTSATYDLFSVDGSGVETKIDGATATTGTNGNYVKFNADLPAGKYIIKQTSVNGSYVQRGDTLSFTVGSDGKITVTEDAGFKEYNNSVTSIDTVGTTMSVTYSNLKKITTEVTKTGETTTYVTDTNGTHRDTEPLQGATFVLSFKVGQDTKYVKLDGINMSGSVDAIGDASPFVSDANGKFTIGWLDPQYAPYTLNETEVVKPSYNYDTSKTYELSLLKVKNSAGLYTHYAYELDDTSTFSITNTIKMYQIELEKAFKRLEGGVWVSKPSSSLWPYMGAEYKVYSYSEGAAGAQVDTMYLGTAEEGVYNTALSKELAAGDYLIIESAKPAGADGITANVIDALSNGSWGLNYGLYVPSGDSWVKVTPDNRYINSQVAKIGMVITLGNAAADANNNVQEVPFVNDGDGNGTGGTGQLWFSRILVQKNGYTISADGSQTLLGAISNVEFDVYLGYVPAGSTAAVKFEDTLQQYTTGTYGTASTGQFLTTYISAYELEKRVKDLVGNDGYTAVGYVLVERAGTLPAGYTVSAAEHFVKIDMKKYTTGQSASLTNGFGSIGAEGFAPVEIKNFKGQGTLSVTKKSLTNTSSVANISGASTYEVYAVSALGATDYSLVNGVTITTSGSTAKTQDLPAGYYYLKETSAPAGHYTYGTFTGGANTNKVFASGELIGPFVVEGSKTTPVTVNNRKMASFTLQNLWNKATSGTLTANYTVSYEGVNASLLPDEFAKGITWSGTVTNNKTFSNLPDGKYTIVETGIGTSLYGTNTSLYGTGNSAVVVVSGGQITSITTANGAVGASDTKNSIWRSPADAVSTANTINVNHVSKGSLIIQMGSISATNVWSESVPDGFSTTFKLEKKVGSDWVAVEVETGQNTFTVGASKSIMLDEGNYRITQSAPATAGFTLDKEVVYFNMAADGNVYLQNSNNAFAKSPAEGRTLGTADDPLDNGNSGSSVHFYNKRAEGQLKVFKVGEGITTGYLAGATFKLYKDNEAGQKVEVSGVTFSDSDSDGIYEAIVEPGTYYVKEVTAPSGYALNTEYHQVTVEANKLASETVNSVTIKDAKLASITVKKTTTYPDKQTGSIAGLKLTLYKQIGDSYVQYKDERTGNPGFTATADGSLHGTYTFKNLEPGNYKVVEALPTNGDLDYLSLNTTYASVANSPVISITHDDEGTNNTLVVSSTSADWADGRLNIHNDFRGARIIVDKYLWNSGKTKTDPIKDLTGFTFAIYETDPRTDSSAEPIASATGTATSNGRIMLAIIATEKLEGNKTYYIKEVGAPLGYVVNDTYDAVVKEITLSSSVVNKDVVVDFWNFKQSGTTSLGITKTVSSDFVAPTKSLAESGFTATYEISPIAPNNALELTNYTVKDSIFTFSAADGTAVAAPTASLNGPEYGLKKVTIMPATYTDLAGVEQPVKAVKVNGTWHALSTSAASPTVIDLNGAATLEIVYSNTNPGTDTATVGTSFVPGKITLEVDYKQFIQDKNKTLAKEVTKITNTANVTADGLQSANATAYITVPPAKLSEMKVTKTLETPVSDANPIYNGDVVKYKITLTNTSSAVDLVAPVLIDAMDAGKLSLVSGTWVVSGAASNSDVKDFEVVDGTGGSVAVWRFSDLVLKPGQTIEITFDAQIAMIIDSSSINNAVYGTSEAALVYSGGNATGASFRVSSGNTEVKSTSQGDEFALLNGYMGADMGLYAKANVLSTTIKQGGLVYGLYSIKKTSGTWNSTEASERVYPGDIVSYQMQVQNTAQVSIADVVLDQKLPVGFGDRGTSWTTELVKMLVLDPKSISVSASGGQNTAHTIEFYDADDAPITVTAETDLNTVAGFKVKLTNPLESGRLLTVTYNLKVPAMSSFSVALLNANFTKLLYSDFSYQYIFSSDINKIVQRATSNKVNAQLFAKELVRGTVFDDTDRDGVMDSGELGISGITVNLYSSANNTPIETTTSGADGTYAFTTPVEVFYTGGPTYWVEFVDSRTTTQFGPGTAYGDGSGVKNSHVINITKKLVDGDTGDTGATALSFKLGAIENGVAYAPVVNAGISVLPKVFYDDGVADGNTYMPYDMPNPAEYSVRTGTTYNISTTEPKRTGYVFTGWNVASPSPVSGDYKIDGTLTSFTMPNEDVTLVAQWRSKDAVKVNFGAIVQNGTMVTTTTYEAAAASAWINPTYENMNPEWPLVGTATAKSVPGYTFRGWYTITGAAAINPAATSFSPDASSAVTLGAKTAPVGGWVNDKVYYYAYFTEDAAVTVNYKPFVIDEVVANTNNRWLTVDSETARPSTGTMNGSSANTVGGYTFIGWYSSTTANNTTLLSKDASWTPSKNSNGIYEGATYYAHYVADTSKLKVVGYEGVYDGKDHGVTVEGLEDYDTTGTKDEVKYFVNGVEVDNKFVDVTEEVVDVQVIRDGKVIWEKTIDPTSNAKVKITPAPLTVYTPSASRAYNGSPLTAPNMIVTGLIGNEILDYYTTGTITNVGTVDNEYVLDWQDNVAGYAWSFNYEIVDETIGTLNVFNADFSITARDYLGYYDAASHGIVVTDVPADATLTLSTANNYTNVTNGAITVNYTVTRPNYNTITGSQTVTILPVGVNVTTESAEKEYDGEALTAAGSISSLVAGETVSFAVTGSQTEVGSSTNTYSLAWNGTALRGNYYVVEDLGTLTVTEEEVPPPTERTTTSIGGTDTPLTNIGDDQTPLAGGHWALVNLILTVIGALFALVMLVSYWRKRKVEEDEDEAEERRARVAAAEMRGEEDYEEEPEDTKKRLAWRIVPAVLAVLAVILFILTENIFLPLVLVDWWTLAHVIVAALQIICWIVASRRKDITEEDTDEEMDAARQSLV